MIPPVDRLLSPKEVTALLGINRRTLTRYTREGLVPKPIRFNASMLRWKHSDILAVIDALAQQAPCVTPVETVREDDHKEVNRRAA